MPDRLDAGWSFWGLGADTATDTRTEALLRSEHRAAEAGEVRGHGNGGSNGRAKRNGHGDGRIELRVDALSRGYVQVGAHERGQAHVGSKSIG